ncbi:hypothetical protein BX265_8371 [Streptomyces sp. TLI_235]|nr:hypothetical protein [Streptomyces sp. TLI_235]PBC66306.1 hypothetical protein BX265_8371 [Streptomyces sp. TLI_235]
MTPARTTPRRTRTLSKKSTVKAPAAVPVPRPHTAQQTPVGEQTAAVLQLAADPALADAADRTADVLTLAEDQALAVLERTVETADRKQTPAERWAGETDRARREKTDTAAHTQADALIKDATAHTGALLAGAGERATAVRDRAEQEAGQSDSAAETRALALAGDVTATAEKQASEALAGANNQVTKVLTSAERDAEILRRQAAHDLADIQEQVADARLTLQHTRSRAVADREQAEQDLTGMRELAAKVQRDATSAADRTLTDARVEAEQIRIRAAQTAREILRTAKEQADQARIEAEEAASRLTETARAEADGIREEAARQTADLRERGQEAVRRLREEAEQTLAEQARLAKAARERADAEAERIVNLADGHAATVTAEADKAVCAAQEQVSEAEDRLKALRAEQARKEAAEAARRQSRQRRVWRWWQRMIPRLLPRIALWAGVAYTAHGEHALAVMAGADDMLAWLLAVCVDVWVIASTRAKARQEIIVSLAVMLFCQIAALLAELHILGVHQNPHGQWRVQWGLAVPLAMVVPVVIWRVHALMDHSGDAHDEHPAPTGVPDAPTDTTVVAHEDTEPRPPHGGHPAPSAHDTQPSVADARGARSPEREITAGGGTSSARRALPAGAGAQAGAHDRALLSDAALMYARKACVRPLYDALGRRPRAAEIHTVLTERGLLTGEPAQTRSTCQRVREAIETDESGLKPTVRLRD